MVDVERFRILLPAERAAAPILLPAPRQDIAAGKEGTARGRAGARAWMACCSGDAGGRA